ncbi:MAG: hypothetical protein ACK5LN_11945 [Propioniciclava sp.]
MDAVETIIWWIFATILGGIALAAASFCFRYVAWRGRRHIDRILSHVPSWRYAAPRALLAGTLVGLTALILHFPAQPPWAVVTNRHPTDEVGPLILLGAAAAMLTLLLSAVNRLRETKQDAVVGARYLGQNIDTHLTLPWVRLLDAPTFVGAASFLFAIPIFLHWLPRHPLFPATPDWGPMATFSPFQFALALWCACFGLVGALLLLNAMSALRAATTSILYPTWLRAQIRSEVGRTAAMEFKQLPQQARRWDQHRVYEGWVLAHLAEAHEIPEGEQSEYLALTLGKPLRTHFPAPTTGWKHHARRALRRGFATARGILPAPVAGLFTAWNEGQFRSRLENHQERHQGIITALLSWADRDDISATMRAWLVAAGLGEALRADQEFATLITEEDTTRGSIAQSIAMRNPEAVLHQAKGLVPPWGRQDQSTPDILAITGTVFHRLSQTLLAPGPLTRATPGATTVTQQLLAASHRLVHGPTQAFVHRTVIRAAVTLACEDRGSSSHDLHAYLTSLQSRPAHTLSAHPTRDSEAIQEVAFATLLPLGSKAPEEISQLLELTRGWQIPAAFLHMLYYARRSHQQVPMSQLCAFFPHLHALRYFSDSDRDEMREPAASFLADQSQLSHFVRKDDIQWLFDSLHRPLSLDLVIQFLARPADRHFSDFTLIDFLRWHALASDSIPGFSWTRLHENENWENLVPHADSIKALADEWKAALPEAAESLEYLAFDIRPPSSAA